MNCRDLTQLETDELARLNSAVDEAVRLRTQWLDMKMIECSKFKVGDELYELTTGRQIGLVTGLYRYHAEQRDWRFDTALNVDYRINGHDNTSRQSLSLATRQEAADYMRRTSEWLRGAK